MDKAMSNLGFRFMSLGFKVRDIFKPRIDVLTEANLGPGFQVLDFGCGSGSYTVIAADMVGATGKVYALDIHPLALKSVQKQVAKKNLTNVETILSDCATGLENGSIDVILLYDVFHDLDDPKSVLQELHRVLKARGSLSFSDHHLKKPEIISKVTKSGLFSLAGTGKITHTFEKSGG